MSRLFLWIAIALSLIAIVLALPKPTTTKDASQVKDDVPYWTNTHPCTGFFCRWATRGVAYDPNWANGGWQSIYFR